MELTNILKRFLMNGVPKMVVKLTSRAKEYETLEITKEADIYVAASLELDTFNAYRYLIDRESLVQIGIYSKSIQDKILKNPDSLLGEYRNYLPDFMAYERKKTIENYVEKNDYYRMLNGLPDYNDTEFVYPSINLLRDYGFEETYPEDDYKNRTPLHLIPRDILIAMDSAGVLKEIQDQYPDKQYISYLGNRKVGIVDARRAYNYDLLYFPRQDDNNRFYRDFLFYYDEAKEYFTSTIYNHNFSIRYETYDGFIGLMILTMTIQRMISSLFKVIVDRDFYDMATLRLFLEAFGVPFVEVFTVHQQRMLVKNLNILLMKKQGTQIMYDILDLLGYDSFKLSKYILIKQHKMTQKDIESDFVPEFIYRMVVGDNGELKLEIDGPSSYDYYFMRVDMKDDDINLVDPTANNAYTYEDITTMDPTWIDDDALFDKLYKMDMNYIETKYTDISVNIRMQEKLFEQIYLGRMLLDKKEDTSKIKISLAKISESAFSLLEVQTFLVCLMCKYTGMVPNILRNPSQVLAVLGFDFNVDLQTIKNGIIAEYEDYKYHTGKELFDISVLDYIKTVVFKTPKDVNDFFVNIRDFEEFLSERMANTNSIDEYHAYRSMYNTLLITSITDETYQDRYGNPVFRYDDYLKELNAELYLFYTNLNKDECVDYINYIGTKFATIFEDTKYNGMLTIGDSVLINGIISILRTFKSLTIDLKDFEIIYVFDSRTRNMMRLLAKIQQFDVTLQPIDLFSNYKDDNNFLIEELSTKDDGIIKEAIKSLTTITTDKDDSLLDFHDTECVVNTTFVLPDWITMFYGDSAYSLSCSIEQSDKLRLTDKGYVVFMWEGEAPRKVKTGTPT